MKCIIGIMMCLAFTSLPACQREKTGMVFSPKTNLALNDGTSEMPSPLESDNGWGSAVYKWHIVDGVRAYLNWWNMGLAFTGGTEEFADTCGWRQAVITFQSPVSFNRIIIWEHDLISDLPLFPDSFKIQCWDEERATWKDVKNIINVHQILEEHRDEITMLQKKNVISTPIEVIFPEVVSKKIRYYFNNCNSFHGWIDEFEVYMDAPGDRPECLLFQE